MTKYQEQFYSPIPSTRKPSISLLPIPAKHQSAPGHFGEILEYHWKTCPQAKPNSDPLTTLNLGQVPKIQILQLSARRVLTDDSD